MDFFYRNALLPDNDGLLEQINLAAGRLRISLQQLNMTELEISEYNQKYFGEYLKNIQGALQICSYLLAWTLSGQDIPPENFVVVDYGGGCGLFSLLAKELGVGMVIHNDIYDVSCNDAELIGQAIKRGAEAYVCGDIDELLDYLLQRDVLVNAIVSYDVIEHIYDVNRFLQKLSLLPGNALKVIFASSANNVNPIIRRRHMRSHITIEHMNREKAWGHKERDSLQSYLSLRKEIIASYAPTLPLGVVDQIAIETRGLVKADIECQLREYLKTASISYKADHPTNTCDPYTGNWAEHLMNINNIKEVLRSAGFEVQIRSGYYDSSSGGIRRLIKFFLNYLISLSGIKGLIIAPYYLICAQKLPVQTVKRLDKTSIE